MTEHTEEVAASSPPEPSAPPVSDSEELSEEKVGKEDEIVVEEVAAAEEENADIDAIEVEEGKKHGESPKVTVHTRNVPAVTREPCGCCGSRCCELTLDIVAVVCLFLMSIFLICGTSFFHPSTYYDRPAEPYAFFVIAAMLFLTKASIEVYKRKGNGLMDIIFSSLGIGAGFFWFIASIFAFQKTMNPKAFGGIWIIGALFNLTLITFDIVMAFRSPTKYLFHAIAMALEWLANLMFMVGAASLLSVANSADSSVCDVENYAGLFISGAAMYFIYAVFFTLKLFLKGITFSVQFARAVPDSEE